MYSLYAGASAQVLLAGLDDAAQKRVLASMTLNRFTEKTITSRKDLSNRLQQIRRDGFAVSRGELDEETFSIAAPILSCGGDVLGGISVGGPLHRLDASKETKYIELVRGGARKIMGLLE
jgi:DNA-binding IclR family transcriptional regulator